MWLREFWRHISSVKSVTPLMALTLGAVMFLLGTMI